VKGNLAQASIEGPTQSQITKNQLLASVTIMSALIAIMTGFLTLRIPPLIVFNLGLLGVYVVAILFGPRIGLLSAGLGSALAELYLMSTRGDPPIFLIGLLAARMPAAWLIGISRKKFPVQGMVVGACLQTAIFLAIDIPILLGIVGNPLIFGIKESPSMALALAFGVPLVVSLPLNIFLVIPAYFVIKGVRAKVRKDFLY